VSLAAQLRLAVERILLARELGYDSVWTAESYGSDAMTPLVAATIGWQLPCSQPWGGDRDQWKSLEKPRLVRMPLLIGAGISAHC
jgi:hypothetical protein